MRSSIKVLAVMAIALWICIGVPVTSLAGTEPKPHDPQQAPTFQDQAKYLSAAQIHSYEAKLSRAESIRTNRQGSMQSSATATYCCIPNSIILSMTVWYEGSGDCMCGPATVTEMLSTTTDYYNNPYNYVSLSTVESDMNINCTYGTYRYQMTNELNYRQTVNTYVWQDINSASDLHYYTSVDEGLYWFPVGYNGETYGTHGYPLDNYQGVNWKHYFAGYAYSPGYLSVGDPHFDYNHTYTDSAVYYFIDNFPYTNQVLW